MTVQTQAVNTSTVEENVNTQLNNANIVNESAETQNTINNSEKNSRNC